MRILPKAALSYEDMWLTLRDELARHVTSKRAPQIVFNLRDLMAELENKRVEPWRRYIRARQWEDKQ